MPIPIRTDVNDGAGHPWPDDLRAGPETFVSSPLPMLLIWGPQRKVSFNNACRKLATHDDQALRRMVESCGATIDAAWHDEALGSVRCQLQLEHAGQFDDEADEGLWCALHFMPVRGAQREVLGVLCAVVDISADVMLEHELAELKAQWQEQATELSIVYANMAEIVFHVKLDAQGRFRFASVNEAFYTATGLVPDDVVGREVEQVVPEPSRASMLAHFHEAISRCETVRWETVSAVYPTGSKIGSASVTPVIDIAGRCTDLIGTVHDITELKETEKQLRAVNADLETARAEQALMAASLRASEERLAFALESAGEGVWDWNVKSDRMFLSKRWREILGLSDEIPQRIGLWFSLMHPDDIPTSTKKLRACLEGEVPVCVCEHRLWHQSGHWIWVETRSSVVARDANGAAERMVGTIVDITETKELRQELERRQQLFTDLTLQAPGALFELAMQPRGRVRCTYISAMARELFERSPREIEQDFKCLLNRVYRPDRLRVLRTLREAAAAMDAWRAEFRVALPQRGMCWRELSAKPTRHPDGSIVWHGIVTDVSERKRNEQTIQKFSEKLERRAHYDALTHLPNRALFRDRLEQEMGHARAAQHGMALLFIDLDRFKEVNDMLGHDAGDQLLAQAARRIEDCLRPGDTVARLGGDEFTVILTEANELAHVEQTAQQIIDVLRTPFQLGMEQANVSGSIGITLYPDDADNPEDLMRNADHAMYRSKAAGRNQLTFFEHRMQAAAKRRLRLISQLRNALSEHQLELHFQPIVDVRTGEIRKAEALLRWHRPGTDIELPNGFVGVAEETGMIHEIGNWVFYEAAHWSKRWSTMLARPFQISINKSPVQFQAHVPAMNWIKHLNDGHLPRHSIAVEITEGVLLNMSEHVFDKLHELHEAGVEVSIDDFGTGYSSMSYLKRLDIDYLKIDRSFVSEMLQDTTSRTITETIIVMAHKLGLKVIAEGVETDAQKSWLADRDCDYMQGFLFAEPVPAAQFETMLARQPFAQPLHH